MLILALSIKVLGQNDIVTFAIVHVAPKEIEADCYVDVFCEYRPSRETCSPFSRQFKYFYSKCSIHGDWFLRLKKPTLSNFDENKRKALQINLRLI